jgi:hypothetical protein
MHRLAALLVFLFSVGQAADPTAPTQPETLRALGQACAAKKPDRIYRTNRPPTQGRRLTDREGPEDHVRVAVFGMQNEADERRVLAALETVPGLTQVAAVSAYDRHVDLLATDGRLDISAVVDAVAAAGFQAEDGDDLAYKVDASWGILEQMSLDDIDLDRCLLSSEALTGEARRVVQAHLDESLAELRELRQKRFSPIPNESE